METSTRVKLHIYDIMTETTRAPLVAEIANSLSIDVNRVRTACSQLEDQHLVFMDKTLGEIRMALPFSAVPTQHRVTVGGRRYFSNCIWDAFGIAAALDADADIFTECSDCGHNMEFAVRNRKPTGPECVIHFAVPAAQWWDDIVYT